MPVVGQAAGGIPGRQIVGKAVSGQVVDRTVRQPVAGRSAISRLVTGGRAAARPGGRAALPLPVRWTCPSGFRGAVDRIADRIVSRLVAGGTIVQPGRAGRGAAAKPSAGWIADRSAD